MSRGQMAVNREQCNEETALRQKNKKVWKVKGIDGSAYMI